MPLLGGSATHQVAPDAGADGGNRNHNWRLTNDARTVRERAPGCGVEHDRVSDGRRYSLALLPSVASRRATVPTSRRSTAVPPGGSRRLIRSPLPGERPETEGFGPHLSGAAEPVPEGPIRQPLTVLADRSRCHGAPARCDCRQGRLLAAYCLLRTTSHRMPKAMPMTNRTMNNSGQPTGPTLVLR
jgi:hypothetical protein